MHVSVKEPGGKDFADSRELLHVECGKLYVSLSSFTAPHKELVSFAKNTKEGSFLLKRKN